MDTATKHRPAKTEPAKDEVMKVVPAAPEPVKTGPLSVEGGERESDPARGRAWVDEQVEKMLDLSPGPTKTGAPVVPTAPTATADIIPRLEEIDRRIDVNSKERKTLFAIRKIRVELDKQ